MGGEGSGHAGGSPACRVRGQSVEPGPAPPDPAPPGSGIHRGGLGGSAILLPPFSLPRDDLGGGGEG